MTTIVPDYPQSFNYYQPILVRYADLDTLLHVNNVSILQYVEDARTGYYKATGIWDGQLREGFGMVVASIKVDYLQIIHFFSSVRVGICVSKIGSKSLRFRFQVESEDGQAIYARGEVVMVSYDLTEDHSRLVPQEWREKLAAFEHNQELLG